MLVFQRMFVHNSLMLAWTRAAIWWMHFQCADFAKFLCLASYYYYYPKTCIQHRIYACTTLRTHNSAVFTSSIKRQSQNEKRHEGERAARRRRSGYKGVVCSYLVADWFNAISLSVPSGTNDFQLLRVVE